MQLVELDELNQDDWNQYVSQHEQGSFFHLAQWKHVLKQAFNHNSWFYAALDNGAIQGVLPLTQVKSLLFGNHLISLPFGVYGGVLASSDAARSLLEQAALEKARSLQVGALEYRNRELVHDDWPTKELYFTFRKEIFADSDANMQAIPRKQRAMVRKGIKAGLVGEFSDDLDSFFATYSESVRNLGTPVFPKKYFRILKQVFAEHCDILMVKHENNVIAAVMSFYFRDEVLPYYGGSVAAARALKGNDFMYWHLMDAAAQRGYRIFDFGRSKQGTGAFSFKKNWGFEPQPLYYQYQLITASEMPEINPNNPKYRLFINWWQKLPLGLANFLGPRLSPYLG
jgi:FemAB-related protein (PEP-CTERM system-associated)